MSEKIKFLLFEKVYIKIRNYYLKISKMNDINFFSRKPKY